MAFLELYVYVIFVCLLISIAIYDVCMNRIPNYLNIAIFLIFLAFQVSNLSLVGLYNLFLGMILGLLILIIPYMLGVVAAGDVKLMGAVGAALGPLGLTVAFLYSTIAGGFYALILMLTGKSGDFPRRLWITLQTFYYTRQLIYDKPQKPEQQVKLCYGVAIAAGTILYIVLEMTGKGQLIQF